MSDKGLISNYINKFYNSIMERQANQLKMAIKKVQYWHKDKQTGQ